MALKIYLYNGGSTPVELAAKNGVVYRDEYNETRDSATVVVRTKTHVDVQPFDFVILSGTCRGVAIDDKPMLVDSFSEEQIGFGDNPVYDTTITLFSETKELERVPLPNLSITRHADGTGKTVMQAIEDYLFQYAPRIKVTDGASFAYEQKWTVSQEVSDRFSSIQCPEFSWNRPTLSEVLTDLMQVDDCIPVIKNHEIGLIDLRERKGVADSSNFVRVVRSMTSKDYNQNLEVNMQNAISSRPARVVEYVSMRNETQGLLTTENMQVVTQKPIYEIKKITMMIFSRVGALQGVKFREIDMTPSVKEKMAYDVLNPVPALSTDDSDFAAKCQTLQIANVWYTRGGRTIEGFGKSYYVDPVYSNYATIEYIAQKGRGTLTTNLRDYRDVMFKVEYLTQGEVNLKAGKKLPLRNCETSAFDNQGSSYVDISQQSMFEYFKANRLANKVKEINGTCFEDDDVPELGQTHEGAVIFSREIQYFDDCIHFHLLATENYVLSNYFTAIRSKARSWAIASGKEALTRHDNAKIYAEFSRTSKSDITALRNKGIVFAKWPDYYDFGPEVILSALYHFYNDESIKFATFTTIDSDNEAYPKTTGTTRYAVDCQVSATGLSLSLTATLSDNYSVGIKVEVQDDRYINNILPYADANGEFVRAVVGFSPYVDPAGGDFVWGGYKIDSDTHTIVNDWPDISQINPTSYASWVDERIAKGREKPIITNGNDIETSMYVDLEILKDNRETFALTAEIEYCADEPTIIVKEALVENHHFLQGDQDEYVGLRILATSAIKTTATLPTASANFVYAGFLVSIGGELQFAHAIDDGNGGYEWARYQIGIGEKFAIIDGYLESQDEPYPSLRGVGTRVVVAKVNSTKTGLQYFEKSIRLFTLNRLLNEDEDDVPSDATVTNDPANVTISKYADNCFRVYYANGTMAACWGFVDAYGKILFAVNRKEAVYNSTDVFVNLSLTRDKAVRRSVALQHIVDRNL